MSHQYVCDNPPLLSGAASELAFLRSFTTSRWLKKITFRLNLVILPQCYPAHYLWITFSSEYNDSILFWQNRKTIKKVTEANRREKTTVSFSGHGIISRSHLDEVVVEKHFTTVSDITTLGITSLTWKRFIIQEKHKNDT